MCGHAGRLRTKSSITWEGERETAKGVNSPTGAAGLGRVGTGFPASEMAGKGSAA